MKYDVIDAHVHPFLPSCGKNIGRFGIPATTEEFFENLQALGISRCCGSFIGFAEKMDFKTLMTYNDAALELREKYPFFMCRAYMSTANILRNPAVCSVTFTVRVSAGSERWSTTVCRRDPMTPAV